MRCLHSRPLNRPARVISPYGTGPRSPRDPPGRLLSSLGRRRCLGLAWLGPLGRPRRRPMGDASSAAPPGGAWRPPPSTGTWGPERPAVGRLGCSGAQGASQGAAYASPARAGGGRGAMADARHVSALCRPEEPPAAQKSGKGEGPDPLSGGVVFCVRAGR
ncbi:MAG: hypothetical protein J3K34DRAFT_405484 [Monoraphidium minutum]|nr:MAG: hypothetical protein J3K34DRAFT_405484 [Monoraphidium minutum]